MSMNAEILIEEAQNIIDDDRYEDTELLLRYFNQVQKGIADTLLLPDLKDGFATVSTVLNVYTAALPVDYHKNIHLAFSGGKPLNTHKSLSDLMVVNSELSTDAGDLTGVTTFSGNLIYQAVPSTVTAIEIFYYKLPTDMTEEATSFPSGLAGNDDFDWALIHGVCSLAFDRIEDGVEGQKVNTDSHKNKMAERIALMKRFCIQEGELYPYRPDAGIGWLGVA